jgi:RinA family phage transcriptional activator
MKNNMFKKTEKTLYNYKTLGLEIESLDIHINSIVNDVSIAGVSYEERSAPTNAIHSSVERQVIWRDEHHTEILEKLRNKRQGLIELDRVVKVALNSLEPEELKIVELRYFTKPKKSWVEIGMILGLDKDTCCRIKNKIINKIMDFIYPNI